MTTRQADLGDPAAIADLVAGHDLAIGAVPGPMGYATLEQIIESGINVVDISFFEEDPVPAARSRRPARRDGGHGLRRRSGFSNLALGHSQTAFDDLTSFVCFVGGLPVVRQWPYEYRAVFSPIDVIAEYTRPARIVEHGSEIVRDALSEIEPLDLPGVGTLEAFNSDGLRTLLRVEGIPDMKEKTLRYPGHAERMRMLRETGFFGEEEIEVDGANIRPIDLTAKLIFPMWQFPERRGRPDGDADRRRGNSRWSEDPADVGHA